MNTKRGFIGLIELLIVVLIICVITVIWLRQYTEKGTITTKDEGGKIIEINTQNAIQSAKDAKVLIEQRNRQEVTP